MSSLSWTVSFTLRIVSAVTTSIVIVFPVSVFTKSCALPRLRVVAEVLGNSPGLGPGNCRWQKSEVGASVLEWMRSSSARLGSAWGGTAGARNVSVATVEGLVEGVAIVQLRALLLPAVAVLFLELLLAVVRLEVLLLLVSTGLPLVIVDVVVDVVVA
eukprot:1045442-Pyramimonas_sp.AAC.1